MYFSGPKQRPSPHPPPEKLAGHPGPAGWEGPAPSGSLGEGRPLSHRKGGGKAGAG